nr:MAG TPA_asm: hypothetical protein [Caudoviricetes sp.]
MSDILVIRVNANLEPRELDNLRKGIKVMRNDGVVLLPDYCEVIVAPEDCEIKVDGRDGNEVKEQKICKYYTEKMSQLVDNCRKLYQYPGWSAGGELHIILDDCNLEDDDIQYCYNLCQKRIVEPAAALGYGICVDLINMSMTERVIFNWIWNGWDGVCDSDSCESCGYCEEE